MLRLVARRTQKLAVRRTLRLAVRKTRIKLAVRRTKPAVIKRLRLVARSKLRNNKVLFKPLRLSTLSVNEILILSKKVWISYDSRQVR
jgi:hypothetical protein